MKLPHSVVVVDWGLPASGLPWPAGEEPGAGLAGNRGPGVAALKAAFTQYQVNCLVTFEGFEDVSDTGDIADNDRRQYAIVRNRSIFNMVVRKDTYQALRATMMQRRVAAVASGRWAVAAVDDGDVGASVRARDLFGQPVAKGQGVLTSTIPFFKELGVFEDPLAPVNPFTRPVLGRARQIAKLGRTGGPSTQWGRGVEFSAYYDRQQTVQVKLELLYDRL